MTPLLQPDNEQFLQKVQVIVKNGFLDSKILNEPISPETFDLVEMLIFYVMVSIHMRLETALSVFVIHSHCIDNCPMKFQEYSRTKNYANYDNNPALSAEIRRILHKINLIQNEIAKCQMQYVQQEQIQQEILRSFSVSFYFHTW